MKDCIFCKIAAGKAPCYKIYEDENFLAILDLFPNTKGMTLVLPKKHFDSDIFELDNENITELLKVAKKVAKMLEKGLGVKRVSMVAEGMGINHLHIKLYPLHGLKDKFKEMWAKKEIYFDKYQGYITTQLGPKKETRELEKLAEKIRNS